MIKLVATRVTGKFVMLVDVRYSLLERMWSNDHFRQRERITFYLVKTAAPFSAEFIFQFRGEEFLGGNRFEVPTGRCGLVHRSDYLFNPCVLRFSKIIPAVFLVNEIVKSSPS